MLNRIRSSIHLLEILELFAICLLWIIWGLFDGRSLLYIAQLIGYSAIILYFAWGFYLLMVAIWRNDSIWLIIAIAVLTAGAAIGGYIFLAVFDLNRLILGRSLYTGDAPIEYFWNKESSVELREWKKARKNPAALN